MINRMNKRIILVGLSSLTLIAIVGIFAAVFARPVGFKGTVYPEPFPPAPDFELISSQGGNLRLGELQGKISLLFFGYTNCPDECPTTMAKLRLAVDELSEKADDVRVLFVTTDPVRDSTTVLSDFLARFNPSFIGLTGSMTDMQKVWDSYGIYVEQGGEVHSNRVYVIDRSGNLRLTFPYDMDPDAMVSDLTILLDE